MRENRNIDNINFERAMMHAIHHWLNYMCKVSRIDILAEDAIKFPLIEYIERNLDVKKSYLERGYEEFLIQDIFNDQKRVDVMWEDEETEYLIELKYVKENSYTQSQRYFNDIVRLSLALKLKKEKKRRCFLLICGSAAYFAEQLIGKTTSTTDDIDDPNRSSPKRETLSTQFSKWLSFEDESGELERSINFTKEKLDTKFKNFIKEYFQVDERKKRTRKKDKSENVKYLSSFCTHRIWLRHDENDEQSAGLWEVMDSSQKDIMTKDMNTQVIMEHLQQVNNELEDIRKRNNDSMQRIKDNNDETKDTNV